MKASVFLMHLGAAALALGAAGCHRDGDGAMRETKFPGMVTAGGGTSGQVMAANDKPKTDAVYAGGTPGIAGGKGGNTGGAETGGSVQETARGPSEGVKPPDPANMAGAVQNLPGGASRSPAQGQAAPTVDAAQEQTPQPAAAHRDPGQGAAPGRVDQVR